MLYSFPSLWSKALIFCSLRASSLMNKQFTTEPVERKQCRNLTIVGCLDWRCKMISLSFLIFSIVWWIQREIMVPTVWIAPKKMINYWQELCVYLQDRWGVWDLEQVLLFIFNARWKLDAVIHVEGWNMGGPCLLILLHRQLVWLWTRLCAFISSLQKRKDSTSLPKHSM